jgi:hypothetical protein
MEVDICGGLAQGEELREGRFWLGSAQGLGQ